ncbi:type 2 lanthipeptide synthetase LanM family protein [Staphylococcus gallinarum]|uniref:type 2 lanthipeptide synthetase LanM family protein n=1 Tax=Staphylococcus gallinarum TaxID=1293 RepID=UPI0030BAB956
MENNTFYKALTLNERIELSDITKHISPIKQAYPYWRKLLEVERQEFNDILEKYLNIHSDDLDKLYEIEGTDDSILNPDTIWSSDLKKLYYNANYSINKNMLENLEAKLFYPILIPIINLFIDKFEEYQFNYMVNENCYLELINQIADEVLQIFIKTLILELNLEKKSGKLKGKTSEEGYNEFCKKLYEQKYLCELIDEYPVLFKLISDKVEGFTKLVTTILFALKNDTNELKKNMLISSDFDGKINNLITSVGDTHNGGFSVSIIELDNSDKIIFKPRDLNIDTKFNNFLHWINNQTDSDIYLKGVTILNKESYGWAEFIDHQTVNDSNELHNFYNNLGAMLAVLYILNATDFHYENLIAYQQYPVLIDLESLIHHSVEKNDKLTESNSINEAAEFLKYSVLSIGILPHRKISINNQTFDISGINDTENQAIPFENEKIENHYTDNIKISKFYGKMRQASNTPYKNNEEFKIESYMGDITDGFKKIYTMFLNNKNLVKKELDKFKNVKVRKILRDTMNYSRLIKLSLHPDFLRNQIDRELLFLRLEKQEKSNKKILQSEIQQMIIGDVPTFYSYTDKPDIYTHKEKLEKRIFGASGLDIINKKIDNLSFNDLKNQTHLIESMILEYLPNQNKKLNSIVKSTDEKNVLKQIEQIADLILNSSLQHEYSDKELIWIGLNMDGINEENWKFSVSDLSLYDGNTGIALFFAYLWKVTNNEKYKIAAYKTIKPILLIMEDLFEGEKLTIGAFEGVSSPIYVLHHLGKIFQDKDLIDKCFYFTKQLDRYIDLDRIFDIVGGASGALLVILNLYEDFQEEWIFNIAERLSNHIINNSIQTKEGIHWPRIGESSTPYIGFSHGVTGILTALSSYYYYKPQKNIYELIKGGMHYEDSFFSAENCNWYSSHLNSYPIAWCHGSPGILLGRKIISENLESPKIIRDSFLKSYNSITHRENNSNYSLCHGELGLLDILYNLQDLFEVGDEVHNIKENLFLSDIEKQYKNYGLMTGLSGLGYGLLKTYFPNMIPSVISLEKPNLYKEHK